MSHSESRKVLFIRLSSLGDVILASSALNSDFYQGWQRDFLCSREYESLLQTHPKINQLFTFERKSGLLSWLKLAKNLRGQGYEEIVDLHRSTRSFVLRFYFFVAKYLNPGVGSSPRFQSISKQRWKVMGTFVFKKYWPRALRPKSWLDQFSQAARSSKTLFPNLKHLIESSRVSSQTETLKAGLDASVSLPLVGIMPSSNWSTKEWPLEKWVDVLSLLKQKMRPVIFGTPKDQMALKLLARLKDLGCEHESFVGNYSFSEVATRMSQLKLFVGVDTGLAHLAQSLSVPTLVIFGPTDELSGYFVWGAHSQAIAKKLWCRPCGKTGTNCLQALWSPQKCLTELSTLEVLSFVQEKINGKHVR